MESVPIACPICGTTAVAEIAAVVSPVLPVVAKRSGGFREYFAPVELCACDGCAHVFNRAFRPALQTEMYVDAVLTNVPVDPTMHARFADLAKWLPDISGAHVVEIGAGGGHLARLLAAQARTVTVIEPCRALSEASLPEPNIRLVRDAFPAAERVIPQADLVIARQVLEHVQDPREFLAGVAALMADDGHAYIEVPCLEYIARHGAVFDVHVQHVQYFSRSAFLALAHSVGFSPVKSLIIKDGHDLGILFRKVDTLTEGAGAAPKQDLDSDLGRLRKVIGARLGELAAFDMRPLGRVALYGATMQGEVFLNLIPSVESIVAVIDDNETYGDLGLYTTKGWFRIRQPQEVVFADIDTIVITAYLHDTVIAQKLRALGYTGQIISTRAAASDDGPDALPSVFREKIEC